MTRPRRNAGPRFLWLLALLPGCWGSCIYFPTKLSHDQVAALASQERWRLETLVVPDEAELVGLVRPPLTDTDPMLLYFGGNAMSLANNQQVLTIAAQDHSWGLAVFSYRGYDRSTGEPDEEHLVEDAERIVDHLQALGFLGSRKLVVLGQSLGTGVASALVAKLEAHAKPVAGLVLLSPFLSMAETVNYHTPIFPVAWSVSDEYPNEENLKNSKLPVLILHGVSDAIVPVTDGRTLAAQLASRATYVEVNRGHNDLWVAPSPAVEPVQTFVKRVTQ